MLFATAAKHLLHETHATESDFPSLIFFTILGSLIKGRLIDIKSANPLLRTSSMWATLRNPPTTSSGIFPITGFMAFAASRLYPSSRSNLPSMFFNISLPNIFLHRGNRIIISSVGTSPRIILNIE